jgi:ribonuclease HI
MNIVIHCDGLCEPKNPGGYACWAWVVTEGTVAQDFGCVAHGPEATNHVATYAALEDALVWCLAHDIRAPLLYTDNQMVVNQVNEVWGCDAPRLKMRCAWVKALMVQAAATLEWIPREQNEVADALSRLAYQRACQGYFHANDAP